MVETTDAFGLLGLRRGLVFSPEEVGTAFREAGKRVHPDAGGGEGEFARLQEAAAMVASPGRRLRLWMELEGLPVEVRGAISPNLMDVFGEVGALMQQAESVIRKRDGARSALGLALLEGETQAAREGIAEGIARVEGLIGAECALFPALEREKVAASGSRVLRNLGFLERWRSGLRENFSRLV